MPKRKSEEEIVTFKEGKSWIAAWSRFDLVAQGKTKREAVTRLVNQIAWTAITDAYMGNLKTFGSAKPVSKALLKRWREAEKRTNPGGLDG